MPEVIVLGSSCALQSATRDNTYMVVRDKGPGLLIDCGGGPIQRLKRAGVDPISVEGLIVTHHHPDHIYGVPALILGMWLMGRTDDLSVFGPLKAVASVASLMDAVQTTDWPGLFRTTFSAVQLTERYLVTETEDFVIRATPVAHMVSCIALRFESKRTGTVMVYSSDTEPCESLIELGQGADLLLHEATGNERGHSTAAQAGAVAQAMGACNLVLVHLPPVEGEAAEAEWREKAERAFRGSVHVARDLSRYEF